MIDIDQPAVPQPTRKKWWRRAVAALVVCVLLTAVVAHLPFVRTWGLSQIVAMLARQGVRLEADRFSYNLLTLAVAMEGVTVAAGDRTPPFLEIDAVEVNLPWSVVTGRFIAESAVLTRPRVTLVRSPDGTLNVPDFGADSDGPAFEGPVVIGRLLVSDLALTYDDATNGRRMDVRGVTLDMHATATAPLGGTLVMSEAATIQWAGHATSINSLAGSLTFDGATATVSDLAIQMPEGTLRVSGTVDALGADPQMTLRYDARVDAARGTSWFDLTPAPTGVIVLAGAIDGDRNAPRVTAAVASEDVTWSTLDALSLDGRVAFADSTLAIETFRVGMTGGELTTAGNVVLGANGASTLDANWRSINLAHLLTTVPGLTVRPGALSDGTLTVAWTGTDVLGGRATITTSQRALEPRAGVLPLAGRLALSTDARRWTLTGTPTVAGALEVKVRAIGQLADALGQTPLDGDATVAIVDLAEALHQLETVGIIPDLGERDALRGVASVALDLGGTLGAPRATGAVNGRDMAFFGTGPASLTTRIDATSRVVTLDDLRLDVGTNHVTAQATLDIAANSLAGSLQAELPDLSAVSGSLPAAWRPSGSALVTATFGGALDNPVADVQMTSSALRVAGQTLDAVESRIHIVDRVATIQSFEVAQGEGRLTATGTYAFEDGRYTFTADGTGLEIAPIVTTGAGTADAAGTATDTGALPLRTRLDLQFTGEGSAAAPQAAGAVQFAHLDWGTYRIGPATADVALADGHARVRADLPLIKGSVDATVALESGHISAVATIADAELAALARASGPAGPAPAGAAAGTTDAVALEADGPVVAGAGEAVTATVPLTGTLRLHATAEGMLDDIAAMTVAVDLNLTDATVNGVPVRVERTARLRHENGTVSADDVTLHLGNTTLTARGRLGAGTTPDDGLNVAVAGSLIELAPLLQLAPGFEDVTVDGNVDILLHASGAFATPEVTAYMTLTGGTLETPDMPAATGIAVAATYTAGIVNVSHISAAWQGAELLALGYAPLSLLGDRVPERYRATLPQVSGPARFDVRVTNLTADALTPLLDSESTGQITGRVDLAADVQATALSLDSISAEVRLDRADVELARVPLAQTRPTRLRLSKRQLDVVDWNWVGEGNDLTVDGHVLLGEEATTLNLGVHGSLDLRMITAVMPRVATGGRATLDITARGTTADPLVEGQVAFDDVDVILRDPRLAITEISGRAVLSRNRITIEGITARANGGTVAITGGVDYSEFTISEGAITFTGRDLAIEAFEGLRTELNTDLTLTMTKNVPSLGGRVTIVRGDYREPLSLTEQVFATLETRTSGPGVDDDEGLLSQLRLDIAVVSDQDIVVNNNYGRLEVGSNLRVTGTAAAPILGGRLAMREGGVIYLGGQTYTLQRGTVDFTNATRIEPNFDIALETRVQSNDITLQLSGTPQALDVSARSPGLSQQDAVSLLLTGQQAEGTMAYTDVARGQLLMLLSGELLGSAGRAVGLDMVQVSRGLGGAASSFDLLATDSDPDARLTIAKHISPELEMIVSQSLRDTGDITWIAIYRPLRRLEFRFATDDDSQETYEFRHELHLGGERTATPARPPQPRIMATHIEGDSSIPNAVLLNELDLGVGDRFDYFDWQRDRDRIAALFHSRGYFEARISARRTDESPEGITLEYEIDPGPHTVLRVEGFTLPGDVVEQIEAAWTQSVFDGFLVDDAEMITRRALVRAHHLQGTVQAVVTGTADGSEKQLTVSIAPGPRSPARRFEFRGNDRVSNDTLRSLAEAQDQGVGAWMAPEGVATAIEAYYRSLGHLTAAVTVDAVRFDTDAAAILPLRIDEGPAYRIGFVGVSGAAFRTAEAVRAVTGLESGEPYRPAAIEPARRAVEVDYLGAGYNDVRVLAIVGVDEDRGLADVVIAVFEGPQQILQEVTASGARITSSGTITNALRLEPGLPLDMTALYAAQKRLYDTNVFQSVDFTVEPVEPGTADAPGTQAVRALVTVQELPRYRFRYGVRVSDSTGPAEGTREISPALVADLMNRNLFGRAISAGVAGQIESDRRLVRGIVSLPSLFGLPAVTSVFVTQSRQDFGSEEEGSSPYVEDETDLTVEQRFRPARTMSVTYGYSLSRKTQFERNPDPTSPFPPLDVQVRVASLTGTYAWDRRDDASNASRGWFHSSGLEYAPRGIGSELRFVRYLAQQYYFRPVGDHAVLASAMRIGLGDGLGEEQEASLSSVRFYAGGASSVRGFREDSIGGRDIFGFPIGGNALLVLNQEIRFPIFRWFRGVAFIDAGNVYPTVGDFSFTDLESGAGVGLRLTSPFAIIRFDYGIPLTSRDTEHNRWYFAIGQTF
jgi:outer membrane protein assembly complex protein YaeT